jgi:hypothetical protein
VSVLSTPATPSEPRDGPGSWRPDDRSRDHFELVRALAGGGSDDVAAAPLVAEPLDAEVWAGVVEHVAGERLEGLLVDAIERGSWAVDDGQREAALARHREAMARALVLDRHLLVLVDRLRAASIENRVLKGAAVAHLDYPDPSLRPYRDVDVLVRPGDIERARDLLIASGGERRYAEPRPGFDRRFGKGIALVMPEGHEIDLHRTLALGPFGLRIDLDELWQGAEPFTVGGQTLAALDRPRRFLHACYHTMLGGAEPPLLGLHDVAVTAPATATDVAEAVALATRFEGMAVVAAAMDRTRQVLGCDLPVEVVAAVADHRPSRRAAAWLRASSGSGRSSASLAMAGLGAVAWRDRPSYLAAVALPRRAKRSRLTRWRRGIAVPLARRRR